MKIFVISDTHGDLSKVYEVFEKINSVDLIIHCGDLKRDAHSLEDRLGIPVVSVTGNCDSNNIDRKVVETPYGNILVVHGHNEGVDYDLSKLTYLAAENDCMCVCFGHTHVPVYEEWDGIYLINPGSLSRPRDGSHGSYAVIHSLEEDFYSNIIYYDTICGEKPKKKVHGGYLRDMLNYSDRF